MSNEKTATEAKASAPSKNLTFNNDLIEGDIVINRSKLVDSINNESRSYAAHSCDIGGQRQFVLAGLNEKFEADGFKVDVVIHLKANASGKGRSKGPVSL